MQRGEDCVTDLLHIAVSGVTGVEKAVARPRFHDGAAARQLPAAFDVYPGGLERYQIGSDEDDCRRRIVERHGRARP